MIVQILKQIANQWRSNVWIMVELFLVFTCLYICCNMLIRIADRAWLDTGFDCEHVYQVSMIDIPEESPEFDANADPKQSLLTLLERLRNYPGVEVVGLAQNSVYPYSRGYSSSNFYHDTLTVNCNKGEVSPGFVQVFRLKTADGKDNLYQEVKEGYALMTPKAMETLFGQGTMRARSYLARKKKNEYTCVAVTPLCKDEYGKKKEQVLFVYPDSRVLKAPDCGIFMRVRPEADVHFQATFFERMKGQLRAGNSLIYNMKPISLNRTVYLTDTHTLLDIYWTIGLTSFFVLCILLGMIGTFWFRTEARTSEIGLRMALGSTRQGVRSQLVCEGLVMFALVWVPGLLLTYCLRDVIVIERIRIFAPEMSEGLYFVLVVVVTTLLMVALIIAGIWYPARRASRVDPITALRHE